MKRYDSDEPRLPGAEQPEERQSLRTFLKGSEIKPLVFVGKCMDYFGMGAVVGFLFGATTMYGISLAGLSPYLKTTLMSQAAGSIVNITATDKPQIPSAPTEPKKIDVHGVVKTAGGKPFDESFQIGVIESVHGPFSKEDASFDLEVPYKNRYQLVVWTLNYGAFRMNALNLDQINEKYQLEPFNFFGHRSGLDENDRDQDSIGDPVTGSKPERRQDLILEIKNPAESRNFARVKF